MGYQWSLGGWTPSRKYESQHDLKSEAQISVQAWFLLSASYGTCQKQKFLIFKNGPMSENSCTVYPMYGPCSWEYDQPSNFMIFPDFPLCFRDKHQSQLTPKTFQVSSHGMMRSMRWHCGSNAALVLADHQPPCSITEMTRIVYELPLLLIVSSTNITIYLTTINIKKKAES